MADDYVCSLDEASLQKAKDELHEDPKERQSQIEALRKWATEQPHIESPTDSAFLLRFLRQGKFSQLRARKTLEGWLQMKTDLPQWFDNVDFAHPDIVKFIKTGYFLVMPKRDPEGRKIIITREGCFEPSTKVYDRDALAKFLFGVFGYLNADEHTMVNGIVMLSDFGQFSLKHQTFWGMDHMKKMTKCWQNNVPGRFKAFNVYHINPVVEAFIAILLPLLSKKFQNRTHLHGNNMESVYKQIPMECLPREYLPDDYTGPHAGTVDELIESMVRELGGADVLQRARYVSDPKWGCNKKKKLDDVPNASFRQLKVE